MNAAGKRFELKPELLELPPGKYTLHYDSPVDLQDQGKAVEFFAGSQTLEIRAVSREPFQYAEIYSSDAFALYHGTIWRVGWSDPSKPMNYELRLHVAAAETVVPPTLAG